MANSWKKISSRCVYKNHWFSVYEDRVIRPDGSKGKYFVFHKGPGVIVVPFDGREIYLVNQYRYTFQKRMWELPAGKCEAPNYKKEAEKELREETGLSARKWRYLGEFACGPGHTAHCGKVYLAQDLKQKSHEREPGEADMIVKKFRISEIEKMISQGKIIDSWTICAFYFFRQYLKKI